MSAAAYATQEQLARHLALHSSSVTLVSNDHESTMSGSFTPGKTANQSVLPADSPSPPQSSGTFRRHPLDLPLMDQAVWDTGLNPTTQLQNDVAAALALHTPDGPHMSYLSQTSRGPWKKLFQARLPGSHPSRSTTPESLRTRRDSGAPGLAAYP
jgi:hypothetical protein